MSGGSLSTAGLLIVGSSCYVWRETINPAGLLIVGSSCYVWRETINPAGAINVWRPCRAAYSMEQLLCPEGNYQSCRCYLCLEGDYQPCRAAYSGKQLLYLEGDY